MNYSDNELKQIEQMAAIYLPISDMATVLGISADQLRRDIKDRNSPVAQAYIKGKVASKIELRKQTMMLAKVGSPIALDDARRAYMEMEDDE